MKSLALIRNIFPVIFFLFFSFSTSHAQDIESFWKTIKTRIEQKDWVKISGGINASSSVNFITGQDRRSDPFSFRLGASLNFDILGIQAPFSANLSSGNKVYKLPSYAFYGISPSYKWIKLHIGDRTMDFSPYTLSGHNFYGTGLELSPGKWRFSAMYGKLKRAVAEDLNHLQSLEPSFARIGWGLKAGYEGEGKLLQLILFQSKDDPLSIPEIKEQTNITPKENTVIGLTVRQNIGQLFNFSVDYGLSALTRNANSPILESSQKQFLRSLGGLFQPKTSSGFYHAVKSSLGLNLKIGQFSLSHERIDPGYKSLGTLYFNNDLENFSINAGMAFFKNKLNLNGSAGLQRNNINEQEKFANKRFIGTLNLSLQANERFNLNLSISNTSNTNRLKAVTLPNIFRDSIILVQTNSSANLNGSYNLSRVKEVQSSLTGMVSYQQANSIENDMVNHNQTTTYYLATLSHVYGTQKSGLTINSSVMVNYGKIPDIELLTYSPGISISKKVLKEKLNLSGSLVYSSVLTNKSPTNQIMTMRLNGSIKLWENHNLNICLSYLNNKSKTFTNGYGAFQEINGSISYGWNFK